MACRVIYQQMPLVSGLCPGGNGENANFDILFFMPEMKAWYRPRWRHRCSMSSRRGGEWGKSPSEYNFTVTGWSLQMHKRRNQNKNGKNRIFQISNRNVCLARVFILKIYSCIEKTLTLRTCAQRKNYPSPGFSDVIIWQWFWLFFVVNDYFLKMIIIDYFWDFGHDQKFVRVPPYAKSKEWAHLLFTVVTQNLSISPTWLELISSSQYSRHESVSSHRRDCNSSRRYKTRAKSRTFSRNFMSAKSRPTCD